MRLAWVMLVIIALPAGAATFIVDSTRDVVDAMPGDGTCATAASRCTLRAAIQEANAVPGADVVTLPAGTLALSLAGADEEAGATGDLDVTESLMLQGAGIDVTVLSGAQLDRVVDVHSVGFQVQDLTVADGSAVGGGGVRVRGASPRIDRVVIRDCSSNGDGGGLLATGGRLTMTDSLMLRNTAAGRGGGLCASEGSLRRCRLLENVASHGAGGGAWLGDAFTESEVRECEIASNSAISGGGLNIGTGLVIDTTVRGNRAAPGVPAPSYCLGGGVYVEGMTTRLENVTITGNAVAPSADMFQSGGGGLATGQPTHASLRHVTVTDNEASFGGGLSTFGYSYLANTIVVGNRADNSPDVFRDIVLQGPSLIGVVGGALISGDLGELIVDPGASVEPLADNGGFAPTHALAVGSPAIDAAASARCAHHDGSPMTADQRGAPRPLDGDGDGVAECDLGAYELEGAPDPCGPRSGNWCDVAGPACSARAGGPGLSDCGDRVLDNWSFDEGTYCLDCPYTFYALVECGREMHLPLRDMEGARVTVTEVLSGRPATLRCLNDAAKGVPLTVLDCISSGEGLGFAPAFDESVAVGGTIGWGFPDCVVGSDLTCTDVPAGGGPVDRLSPGEYQTMDCYVAAPTGLCGLYRIDVDSGGYVWDLFANCEGSATPQFRIFFDCAEALTAFNPLPELALANLVVSGTCPDLEVGFDLQNLGCTDYAGPVTVSVTADCIPPIEVALDIPGPIPANGSVPVTSPFLLACDATLTVTVDPMDAIAECTESGSVASCNQASGVHSLSAPVACCPVGGTPPEVSGLLLSRAGTSLTCTWSAAPAVDGYRVLRGGIDTLWLTRAYDHAADDDIGAGACDVQATTLTDPDDAALDGERRYYLVVAWSRCGGDGPAGFADTGAAQPEIAARLPTPSCP